MDAIKFLKEETRMCACFDVGCDGCPLNKENVKRTVDCNTFINKNPDIAVKIVEQWSKEHPVMTNEGEWIPCSERLPESDKKVLVQTKDGLMTDGRWTGDIWFTTDDYSCYKVVAWMPLPEPYKAESEDK